MDTDKKDKNRVANPAKLDRLTTSLKVQGIQDPFTVWFAMNGARGVAPYLLLLCLVFSLWSVVKKARGRFGDWRTGDNNTA